MAILGGHGAKSSVLSAFCTAVEQEVNSKTHVSTDTDYRIPCTTDGCSLLYTNKTKKPKQSHHPQKGG